MGTVKERLTKVKEDIINLGSGREITLVAVSKYAPDEKVMEAYDAGHRDFGESYVQQLKDRAEKFPEDIRWHMIGHLQRNKVKYLSKIPNLVMIHSIDSIRLVKEIEKRFENKIDCLVEINLSGEDSKSGILPADTMGFFEKLSSETLEKVNVKGLMTISPFDGDDKDKEECFCNLKKIRDNINTRNNNSRLNLIELSMGMTDDYRLALKEGSTILRIGSYIFT
ncbi:MAG: YggS family pyridoxal phosphate-dependent enzyme [Candidatus Muiribacterium halophilum]|uniref:Pyridoxal phosphate homeostasis protein n=1 Tax=Muiribacterium halophilum TaxID=2053465 RepID=A0A2N5Z9M4_MUIH1|nr:MAG: YggS family pyridoxal phosphate-dependent enzyme [Candidatus Muirbacterium halophilum]